MSDHRRFTWGWLLVALLVTAAAGWWFWSRRLPQPPPRFAEVHAPPPPEPSVWTVPVRIAFDDLASSIEQQIPEDLAHVEGEEVRPGWLLDLDLRRPGGVTVAGADQTLVLEVPLALEARAFRAKKAERRADRGKDAPQGLGVSFEGVLELAMALSLDAQWSLHSETELAMRWTDKPTLEVGPFKLPVAKLVDKALKDKLGEVADQVDAKLAERDPTHEAVERAWAKLSSPVQLSVDPPVWLVAHPEELFASDLSISDGALELMVGYRGGLQTVLGPPPGTEPGPLPDRSPPPAGEPGFALALPVALGWDELSTVATAAIGERTSALADSGLTITGLELYPSGDRVAVRVDVLADELGTEGTVYFVARPELDRERREVRLADFAYVLDTNRVLIGANALAQAQLEEWIEAQLVFPFGEPIDRAVAQADAGLRGGRPTRDGGRATGTLSELALRDLAITESALILDVRAAGTVAIQAVPRPPDHKSTNR